MQLKFRPLLLLCLVLLCGRVSAQTPTGSLGDPVVQEDFGSGNTPHYPNTGYIYIGGSCPASKYYALAKTEGGCHDTWHTLTKDHTGNDGYMMIVDANEEPSLIYTQETPPVLCGGTFYEFSAYVKNLVLPAYAGSHSKPDLTFRIEDKNGNLITPPINTGPIYETADPDYWQKVSTIVRIPLGTDVVVVKLFNNGIGLVGNDFALDDIAFRAYGPVIQADFEGSNSSTQQNLCVGEAGSYTINAALSDITPDTKFQWQQNFNDGNGWANVPSNGNAQSYRVPLITDAQIGTYQYRLGVAEGDNINSPHCRVYSNPVTIKVNDIPHPPPLSPVKFCEGETISVPATDGATYKWTGGNLPAAGVIQNPLVIPNASFSDAGDYHVDVISAAGCSTPLTVTVTISPKPIVASEPADPVICEGGATAINTTSSGAVKFSWSPSAGLSNPNIASPFASPAETTTYTLTATNANDCPVTTDVTITVDKKPVVSAGNNKAIFEGQSITLGGSIAGDITGFTWSPVTAMDNPTSLTPTVSPTDDITYKLSVTTATCGPLEKTVSIRVYKKIVIPNSFSPNNDGVNDLWNIEALFTYAESTTSIFDRNGQQVFFSRGYNVPWDGKRNGSALPSGTYYYVIDLKNGTAPIKGWVLIIR